MAMVMATAMAMAMAMLTTRLTRLVSQLHNCGAQVSRPGADFLQTDLDTVRNAAGSG